VRGSSARIGLDRLSMVRFLISGVRDISTFQGFFQLFGSRKVPRRLPLMVHGRVWLHEYLVSIQDWMTSRSEPSHA
jgi:hypothetical protein